MIVARRDALHRARAQNYRERTPFRGYYRIAAEIAALLCIVVTVLWELSGTQAYSTSLGERRLVTLADGSKITLDSASKVTVHYSADARKLTLVAGQARFDVAHDVERPFSVRARERTIVATGTAFDVDVVGASVRVTLIEGHVVVLDSTPTEPSATSSGKGSSAVEMRAGQQLIASPRAPARLATVSLDRETAWEYGQIIVDNETLVSVVERISRYSAEPVIVVDPAIAELRLSGVFNAGDVRHFIDMVTVYLPVEAITPRQGQIELRPRK